MSREKSLETALDMALDKIVKVTLENDRLKRKLVEREECRIGAFDEFIANLRETARESTDLLDRKARGEI